MGTSPHIAVANLCGSIEAFVMYRLSARILLLMVGLVSCQQPVPEPSTTLVLGQFAASASIKTYLNSQVASRGFNGRPYCAYNVLGAEATDRGYNIYLWTLCQEYYPQGGRLEQGTGSSFPVALVVQGQGNGLTVIRHRQPRDGALYAEDMPQIFPKDVLTKLQSESVDRANQRVAQLQADVQKEAEANQ
jgi:hypothetical protein